MTLYRDRRVELPIYHQPHHFVGRDGADERVRLTGAITFDADFRAVARLHLWLAAVRNKFDARADMPFSHATVAVLRDPRIEVANDV